MFVAILHRLRPLRALPTAVKYLLTAVIVLACCLLRVALEAWLNFAQLPLFLIFLPAVILAAVLFDSGSGFVAVLLSTVVGMYFFTQFEPGASLANVGAFVGPSIFVIVGMMTAAIIEALRSAIDQLQISVSALQLTEEERRNDLALMTALMEGTADPIFAKDLEGRYVHINAATARVFGRSEAEVLGRTDAELMAPEDAQRTSATDLSVMTSGERSVTEEVFITDNVRRTFLTGKSPWYDAHGRIIGLIGMARDIHRRKLMEDQLRMADAQKHLLLRDINHRVKNHLQTLASLLGSVRLRVHDALGREALDVAVGQVHVLARVYDRLQLREGSTAVDVGDFLESLCTDLRATLLGPHGLVVHCAGCAQTLDSSQAVLLGLSVNELVTNAVKYAFGDGRQGVVEVSLYCDEARVRLEVADNGRGIATDARPGRGQRLVRGFARQLEGSVEWSVQDGTRAVLSFPIRHAA